MDGREETSLGLTNDIGEDGVSATVSEPLKVGDAVTVRFTVAPMEFRAVVRFQRGLFCGFEFLLLSEEAKEGIKTLSTALLNRN